MQNLKISEEFSALNLTDVVFYAARSNPDRNPVTLANGYFHATFKGIGHGLHICTIRNSAGAIIATAEVDEFDM